MVASVQVPPQHIDMVVQVAEPKQHTAPSLRTGCVHIPAEQKSCVHSSPSSAQLVNRARRGCSQAVAPHESFVQSLPSSQPTATHKPAQHSWPMVHVLVREHMSPTHVALSQGPGMHVAGVHSEYWHPVVGLHRPLGPAVHSASIGRCSQPPTPHESPVHATPSSQPTGTQPPAQQD